MTASWRSALLAGALAAGAASPALAQQPQVGVLLKTLSNPYWGAVNQGVKAGGAKAGAAVFVDAVENDQSPEPQLNACDTMLERKPAALLAAAINSTNLLPCLKQANEAHIPVVNLDNNLDPAVTKKAGVDLAFGIGSDNRAAGAKAADFVAQTLGAGAKGDVLVILGIAGNTTSQARAGGFVDELKAKAPGLKVAAQLPGDWDRQKAANITNDTLQRDPDLAAIFACNDGMVLGALEAARGGGDAKVVLIGVDGDADAIKAIRAGRLNATVAQLPYLMGEEAVTNAVAVLHGQSVPAQVVVPTLVVTKPVLDANSDPLLKDLH
jgi:ABC-type sugar transport system substrate-binding protein